MIVFDLGPVSVRLPVHVAKRMAVGATLFGLVLLVSACAL